VYSVDLTSTPFIVAIVFVRIFHLRKQGQMHGFDDRTLDSEVPFEVSVGSVDTAIVDVGNG
jgi:hypothetical protein